MRRSPSRSTGTTGFEPIYPMIPHISDLSAFLGCPLLALRPAFDIGLTPPCDAERPWRHILGDRRSRSDVGALSDTNGRNQLAVAADECAVLDVRLVFLFAVVIAGDRPSSDVHVGSDGCIAQIS